MNKKQISEYQLTERKVYQVGFWIMSGLMVFCALGWRLGWPNTLRGR